MIRFKMRGRILNIKIKDKFKNIIGDKFVKNKIRNIFINNKMESKFINKKLIFVGGILILILLYNSSQSIAEENLLLEFEASKDNLNLALEAEVAEKLENTNLKILRLEREGISPAFNPNEREYYLVVDSFVNNLNITAEPENTTSTVTITGNTDLKLGKNIITIKVETEDKKQSSEYKIYVTKTDNLETANANLENLAVKEGSLSPEFDTNITKYNVEVSDEVKKIELLAIAQSQKAIVDIVGDDVELKTGENKILIEVKAEDGITTKKYEINVYKRSGEEQLRVKEQQVIAKRIVANIQQNQIGNNNIKNIEEQNGKNIAIIVLIIFVTLGTGYFMVKKKRHG